MRIVLDLQACQSPESSRRGIGRYSLALAKAIAAEAGDHEVYILLSMAMQESIEGLRAEFDDLLPQSRLVTWQALTPTRYLDPGNRFRRRASEVLRHRALRRLKPDVVHTSSIVEGFGNDLVASTAGRAVYVQAATLYDLIPLVRRDTYLANPTVETWYLEKIEHLKRQDVLLGISQFSCDEAIELLGVSEQRLVDISGAADDLFRRLPDREAMRGEVLSRLGITRPFVLYAGGFDVRKNILGLVRAFARLPRSTLDGHQLVIVGDAPDGERRDLEAQIRDSGLSAREVVFAGYVADETLVQLYNLCALCVIPSFHEGFGLPALEAMACGAVVVGSNTSSLPQVIGRADALFDPHDDQAIAGAMHMALTDHGFRSSMIEHGRLQCAKFSWRACARAALSAFERAVEGFDPVVDSRHGDGQAVVEVSNDAAGGRSLDMARRQPTDLALEQAEFGHALAELARIDCGAVTELTYRWGGYRMLAQGIEANLAPEWLDDLPPGMLNLFGRCQVVHSGQGDGEWSARHLWREEIRRDLAEVFASRDRSMVSDPELKALASALTWSERLAPGRQWLVDVSNLAKHDAGTGIQRVVRHVLDEWMEHPPEGFRVEPVVLDDDGALRYARAFCQRRYFEEESLPADELVVAGPGDVYLGLDLVAHLIPAHSQIFRDLRDAGVEVYFVIYDLLPILRPDCFEPPFLAVFRPWLERVAEVASGVVCISHSVADEFNQWLDQSWPERRRPLLIGAFHLGSDFAARMPAAASAEAVAQLELPDEAPTILIVGTIEPRKGHRQVLEAFEWLWKKGANVHLLIIGKCGWMTEDVQQRIRDCVAAGRSLRHIESAGDDVLLAAYQQADALLMASEGEGFGLPLIEAAQYRLPIIARDLPVFREVLAEDGLYFSGFEAEDLAPVIEHWIEQYRRGTLSPPPIRAARTWAESADQLVDVVRNGHWLHRWKRGQTRRIAAYDYRLATEVGTLHRGRMRTTSLAGLLVYGPYISIPAGVYAVQVVAIGAGPIRVDVCSDQGSFVHAEKRFHVQETASMAPAIELQIHLQANLRDMEIRVAVDRESRYELVEIRIQRLSGLD